jgi:D-alanyl-D-alanine carboxypeptidase
MMRKGTLTASLVGLLGVGLVLASGCGDDDASPNGGPTPVPTADATPSPVGPDAAPDSARTCSAADVEGTLRAALDTAEANHPGNPGWLLTVRAPSVGVDFHAAVGTNPDDGQRLSADATFRIASVTKTFVAVAILRLVEDGKLAIDAPIAGLLPSPYPALLIDGGYDPSAITVRQLLAHTSGLFDYAQSDAYLEVVFSDPSRAWTREDQVRFAMEHGKPVGKPGEKFEYSDTGYILLGAVLETVTGKSLAAAIRELDRFDALGLTNTWLETLESEPAGALPRAPQTYDGTPLTAINATTDVWGGGGLVSNTRDVEGFFRALFEARVFAKPQTLVTMRTKSDAQGPGALGIFVKDVEGTTCFYHEGFWGILSLFCPGLDLGVVAVGMETQKLGTGAVDLVRLAIRTVRDCK